MSKFTMPVAALLLALAGVGHGASAGEAAMQAAGYGSVGANAALQLVRYDGYEGPRGSFSRTCSHIRVHGWILRAQCEDLHGRWRWTSIDFGHCRDHAVANHNGHLVCGRR